MNYKNIKFFVLKWHLSERRIRFLCEKNKIEGAIKIGKSWFIPINANRPIDARLKVDNELFYKSLDFKNIDKKKDIINSYRPFSKTMISQLRDKISVDWTYNSNAIEGNTLTLSETKVVLERGITIKGKTIKEHLEAINHKEAIEYIVDLVSKNKEFTEYDIKSIHYLILKGIDNDNAGKYRNENVFISGATNVPPLYINVPYEMQKLIINYNKNWKDLHPVIKACYLHGELAKIHPFVYGNGRTARLLLNLVLMKYGYPIVIIKNKNRLEYYDALDKAHIRNDYTDFIKIVVSLVEESENDYLFSLEGK